MFSTNANQGPVDHLLSPLVHHDTYPAVSPAKVNFDGKSVLVTGASRGVGLVIATSFAKAGASNIAIAARSDLAAASTSIAEAAVAAGRRAPTVLALQMEMSNPSNVAAAADKVRSSFGRLDIVINSAGILAGTNRIVESDPEGWMDNFDVNVKGFYLVLRAFIPLLIDSDGDKTIINLSSIGAHSTTETLSGYQVSKLATLRLAEFAAAEYGDKGLVAYCVHPGSIMTEMVLKQWGDGPEVKASFTDTPELAADSLVYLTSEKRDWLSGRYINLNWDLPSLMDRKDWIVTGDKLKVKLSI